MSNRPLDGMRILLLEDEALIAMDVEQLCLDCGASDVVTARTIAQAEGRIDGADRFDAAIVDMMLGGMVTTDIALRLQQQSVPFVFATGYSDSDQLAKRFPGIAVIGKPYVGEELIHAVASAARSNRAA